MSQLSDGHAIKRTRYSLAGSVALGYFVLVAGSCGRGSDLPRKHSVGGVSANGGESATAGASPSAGQPEQGGTGDAEMSGTGGAPAGGQEEQGGRAPTGGGSGNGGAMEAGEAGTGLEWQAIAKLRELANTYCSVAVGCCSGSFGFPSVATCADAVVGRMPVASISSGAVSVDLQKVELCRTSIATTRDCKATPDHPCRDLYIPAQLPGQACSDRRECVQAGDGVDCVLDGSSTSPAGVCSAITRGKSGDVCLSTCVGDGPCAPITRVGSTAVVCYLPEGLYCDTTEETPTCKPILQEGELCGDVYSCGVDAECYYESTLPGGPTLCESAPGWIGCDDSGCEGDLVCIAQTCQIPTTFDETPGCGSALLSF